MAFYGMMSGAKHLYSKVPTEDEVRPLFEDAESFQKFLDGEDYSYGLADVPDAEYDEHYEAIVEALKCLIPAGLVVDLPAVPHQFLREAPLVDGDWIDNYMVELAEWGRENKGEGIPAGGTRRQPPYGLARDYRTRRMGPKSTLR